MTIQKTEGGDKQAGGDKNGGEKKDPETFSAKDYNDLKGRLDEAERARKKAEKDLAAAQGEKEKLSGAKKERDDLLDKGAQSGDKDAQARKEQVIRDEMQGKIDAVTKENETLKARLHQVMVVDRAMAAVGGKFRKDVDTIVRGMVKEAFDWEGDPDTGALFVKDAKGQARFKEGTNQRMTPEDWAEDIGKKHPSLLDPQVVSGGKEGGEKKTAAATSGAKPPAESASWGAAQWQSWMSGLSSEDRKAFMKSQGMM